MSHELKEGVALKQIVLVPDPGGGTGIYRVGDGVRSIVVVNQTGQMAMVPWAQVAFIDNRTFLVNLANVESVELEQS